MSSDDGEQWTGRVDQKRRKAELVGIARALKIALSEPPQTSFVLAGLINEHLKQHSAELSADPRFQGLYVYRPQAAVGKSKQTGKTSADKAAEDETERGKEPKAPTGAHKKLLDAQLTSDPPARFKPLNQPSPSSHKAYKALFARAGSQSSMASSAPSGDPSADVSVRTPSPIPAEQQDQLSDVNEQVEGLLAPKTPTRDEKGSGERKPIVVLIRDKANLAEGAQEIYLASGKGGVPIVWRSVQGVNTPCVLLSDVLPAVIKQSTPMKNRNGRFYRAGFAHADNHIALGSLKALASGDARGNIALAKVDTYALEETEDGEFWACEVFLEYGKGDDELLPALAQPTTPAARVSRVEASRGSAGVAKPGVGASSVIHKADKDATVAYLYDFFGQPCNQWPKAEKMEAVLERRAAVEDALARLKPWARRVGGYVFPPDLDNVDLAGRSFTKDAVTATLGLKNSGSSDDARLLDPETYKHLPELRGWLESDDPINDPRYRKFAAMTPAQFKRYIKEGKHKRQDHSEASRGKRRAERDSSVEAVDERTKHRKKRSRRSRSHSVSSNNLDRVDRSESD